MGLLPAGRWQHANTHTTFLKCGGWRTEPLSDLGSVLLFHRFHPGLRRSQGPDPEITKM